LRVRVSSQNRFVLDTIREGWEFEAKKAGGRDGSGSVPVSFWETYSAMANTQGGYVLLGAQERSDGSLELVGIGDVDKVERDLWTTLHNPGKVSACIVSRSDVETLDVDGRKLLLVHVPKARREDLPVHINGSWETGTYLRVHEGDHRASRDVARRMLADSVDNRDSSVVEEMTFADFDTETLILYRGLLTARREDHPFLVDANEGMVEHVGADGWRSASPHLGRAAHVRCGAKDPRATPALAPQLQGGRRRTEPACSMARSCPPRWDLEREPAPVLSSRLPAA